MTLPNGVLVKQPQRIEVPPEALVGVVKKVISGDSVVLHGLKGNPPVEKELIFLNVRAAKLGRRSDDKSVPFVDEPWGWEAREYLRKKIIGQKVYFSCIKIGQYEYGYVWHGKDRNTAENVVESLVREGLITVKKEVRNSNDLKILLDIEKEAKELGRGRFSNVKPIIRDIKWFHENPSQVVEMYERKPIKAIIEYVRDGSTLRALLLPEYRYITLSISGIRCPPVVIQDKKIEIKNQQPYAFEARFFVEHRLLNRDVEIVLETVINNTFLGSILDPRGNIAEALLKEGLAKTVEWNLRIMGEQANRLRAAEQIAKQKRLRLWKDEETKVESERDVQGTVVEIFLGDAIGVKLSNNEIKKVFFSSIKPPRSEPSEIAKTPKQTKPVCRLLYDIRYLFQTREFLRKKLIGKTVWCKLDYIILTVDKQEERHYYSVFLESENVGISLVEHGLANPLHYKFNEEQRSPHYETLLKAQQQAMKEQKGIYSQTDNGLMHIFDLTLENKRIRTQFLTSWQRIHRIEAIVEGLTGPARFRLYLPKFKCLVIFVLSGIVCPRVSKQEKGRVPAVQGEPFGEEALMFSHNAIFQQDVLIKIDTMDKFNTAVIGWLFLKDGTNLSVKLVEEGLADLHISSEKCIYYRQFREALKQAQESHKNLWSLEGNEEKVFASSQINDIEQCFGRDFNLQEVLITEVTKNFTFYAQELSKLAEIQHLSAQLQILLPENPSNKGHYIPKKGDICAGQFSVDKKWYRARIESIKEETAVVFYIDYGNSEMLPFKLLTMLPPGYQLLPPYAKEYTLALVELPLDSDDQQETLKTFAEDILNHQLLLNVELQCQNEPPLVTLYTPVRLLDVAKMMIADGLVMVPRSSDPKLLPLLTQYQRVEENAFHCRLGIWKYGDIKEDDWEAEDSSS